MTDEGFQLIAITLYFIGMLLIGWFAYRRTSDLDDYMLAGRGLKPGVAALSAGASDMSGWLLMGLPGALYLTGLVEAWIAIGLLIGAWLNWTFVAPRLRSYTEVAKNSITIPSFLENRVRDRSHVLRIGASIVILAFFTFYVSSGFVAAGVFFESSFQVPYLAGMLLVAAITLVYTLFGGFLGATLTDVAQGLLMLAALVSVPIVTVIDMGGIGAVVDQVTALDPNHLNLIEGGTVAGIISAAAWGLGYFGQPHIIVRFMALRSPGEARRARTIGMGWMLLTTGGAVATGLIGFAYFATHPELTLSHPEAVFLQLSQIMFHPFVAGLVLAAVLAAIMSTVSSQLIVTSSALVEDLYTIVARRPVSDRRMVALGRAGVLVVAVVAGLIALDRTSSILELVGFAWAGFGAAFGPIILLSLFWKRLTAAGAVVGMVVGTVTVFIWGKLPIHEVIYELIPGFALALIAAVVVSLAMPRRAGAEADEIAAEFTAAAAAASRKGRIDA
ncbi:sodium/proline symporter PutP [Mycetocola reblochoni]|uniref:Sodium/proline symporter n=2 Tax=Mycetocola reblochoni TaxID=331618 RepID=A0A1R4IIF1_9MICO|nr:sodium/proline symporter PutP [Mycetocola reblochoni]RLP69648.1 sodium/proline symporter PutP [Mycetocola reblochoni]SJN19414.1 Proline/sodium symporter PutP (TC 2.A.21.2.1) @ Propionate/sodium symporter [Mycetocola reblochoni REB411]